MTPHRSLAAVPDPDEARYAALGIPDPSVGRALHVAFSRVLGEANGLRKFVRDTCAALAGIGRLEFRRADGTLEPALAPELDSFGWSSGVSVLKRLELTAVALDREWDKVHAADGIHASLPLDLVLEFFPAKLWPLAAQLLVWGPAETCERLERFARLEALREIKPTRARPEGGTLSAGAIDNLISGCRRLLAVLCEMRMRGYPAPVLEQWSGLPARVLAIDLGATEARTDRTAPPLLLVRRTLKTLTAEIERRSQTKRGSERLKLLLRKRLFLALLAVTGARIAAITACCVRDYEPAHCFPDGVVGPALRIFPGKTIRASESRWKPLPIEVAGWLEHYLAYLGISDQPQSTLWPSGHKPGAPIDARSFSRILVG